MTHTSIQLHQISLSFAHKLCFEDFSSTIMFGDRIAIIGRNGSGKSSLLRMLVGQLQPHEGEILMPADIRIGYVPQIITEYAEFSGGQRFQKELTRALLENPDVLLLDEPTNHLDQHNRQALFNMLHHYVGTVILVSHDVELLQQGFDKLWHIDQESIHVFAGSYENYQQQLRLQRAHLENQREQLKRQEETMHQKRMQEQQRSAKSKAKGQKSIEQRKWPTVVSKAKANQASTTAGRKLSEIVQQRADIQSQLKELYVPEIIVPTFHLDADQSYSGVCVCVAIHDGEVGYTKPLLSHIHVSLHYEKKLGILGNNGSGKSTLLKAILGDTAVKTAGEWHIPKRHDIGYLDQHYQTLDATQTVLQSLETLVPNWTNAQLRQHLSTFLFRKTEAVSTRISNLSGGERARLCLAHIAAKPSRLLLLDEITNNIDLETRAHLIQVLREYPGAMMVVSHDRRFMEEIGVEDYFTVSK